jgi:hypothetical protein
MQSVFAERLSLAQSWVQISVGEDRDTRCWFGMQRNSIGKVWVFLLAAFPLSMSSIDETSVESQLLCCDRVLD